MHAIDPKSGFAHATNLLHPASGPVGDVYDRECVWVWQLGGNCREYPDFGDKRIFRLRGMNVTLTFRNIEMSPENEYSEATFKSFDLYISVHAEACAISSKAEASPFEAPDVDERGCHTAKPNAEDLRLRNPAPSGER